MDKKKVLTTIDEIKAYNDPYRLKIFLNFVKVGRPATGKEIADIMNELPSKIHYHIKKMEKYGILTLVYTKNVNGIIAKYYEPAAETITVDNSYLDDNSKKIVIGEVSKGAGLLFDKAKEDFIAKYQNYESQPDNEKYKYGYMLSEIHLTDEEAKKLFDLISKAKTEPKGNDKKTYSIFMSYIRAD